MSQTIVVNGLRVLATHGVLEEEKQRKQPFEIDFRMETDFSVAAASDNVCDTVDYSTAVEEVVRLVASTHFSLLEALAEAIVQLLMKDDRVNAVTVAVRKLRPPLVFNVANVGVVVSRVRAEF